MHPSRAVSRILHSQDRANVQRQSVCVQRLLSHRHIGEGVDSSLLDHLAPNQRTYRIATASSRKSSEPAGTQLSPQCIFLVCRANLQAEEEILPTTLIYARTSFPASPSGP